MIERYLPRSWQAKGVRGLKLPRYKPSLNDGVPTQVPELGVPDTLVLPLVNYLKHYVDPLVVKGQSIEIGQLIAPDLIASASGIVDHIGEHPIIHPSGMKVPSITIKTHPASAPSEALYPPIDQIDIARIRQCGVHGLGGAGYSTAGKLDALHKSYNNIDTLIINGVECEPIISCDEFLMRVEADNIIQAISFLAQSTKCKRCVLAIEEDKTEAIEAIRGAIQKSLIPCNIELQLLAPIYPAGAERTLVSVITGKRLSHTQYPATQGILCINVATAVAVFKALQGHPMISRIVTIAGELAENPINISIRLGTPIITALEKTGNLPVHPHFRVRAGGPLSGFTQHSLDAPIIATTNCLTVERLADKHPQEQPCIRCSACSDTCPVELMPQQLLWLSREQQLNKIQRYGLDDCIECGCCDAVCPSQIPLTPIFRHTKGLLKQQRVDISESKLAKHRSDKRQQRLFEKQQSIQQQRQLAAEKLNHTSDPIKDALARSRNRRKKQAVTSQSPPTAPGNQTNPKQ